MIHCHYIVCLVFMHKTTKSNGVGARVDLCPTSSLDFSLIIIADASLLIVFMQAIRKTTFARHVLMGEMW